ncbi:MAG: saccharopine dehydrogenase C-terminal domain-containing protein [Lacibacter sp.]
MKTILVFGAGKSATVLIDYLKTVCIEHNWKLILADNNLELAQSKAGDHPNIQAVAVNATDADERSMLIEAASLVISLLPPALHIYVARDCVAIGRSLLTASYVDAAIKNLEAEINSKELLFLCEMGLDPGIDHMSAMQLIDNIHSKGGTITSFLSHCGGLVAPESDNNPWHYKISWNPRNVVLAGKAGAVYKEEGTIRQKQYSDMFNNCSTLHIKGLPLLAWYPNRDSLSYIPLYHLETASTFIRTTLRYADFCLGWDALIELGITDENDKDLVSMCRTNGEWFQSKLKAAGINGETLLEWLHRQYGTEKASYIQQQLAFLELDRSEIIPTQVTCSADLLQYCLEQKLLLHPTDKDLVVMMHEIEYTLNEQHHKIQSSLIVKGNDHLHTAMAQTVGLPLGIAARLILEEKIKIKGLQIPTASAIYEPVLHELKQLGIAFRETETIAGHSS